MAEPVSWSIIIAAALASSAAAAGVYAGAEEANDASGRSSWQVTMDKAATGAQHSSMRPETWGKFDPNLGYMQTQMDPGLIASLEELQLQRQAEMELMNEYSQNPNVQRMQQERQIMALQQTLALQDSIAQAEVLRQADQRKKQERVMTIVIIVCVGLLILLLLIVGLHKATQP